MIEEQLKQGFPCCVQCCRRWNDRKCYQFVCTECLEARRQKLREMEARYPSAEALGLTMIGVGAYQPPVERFRRPSSSGKRIIRKSEPMGG